MKDTDINRIKRTIQYHQDKRQGELFSKEKENQKKEDKTGKGTTLVVPNQTTYMKVGEKLDKEQMKDPEKPEIPKDTKFLSSFTPVQLKVVVYLIKEIQQYIRPQLEAVTAYAKNKTEKKRLALIEGHSSFVGSHAGNFIFEIPKKLFVSGRNYARLEKEIQSLAWIPVQFKTRHPKNNRPVLKSTTLFSTYEYIDKGKKRSSTFSIEMQKEVLLLLSSINVAPKGKALWDCDYYNRLCYDVIINSQGKYTGLLYFLLCRWKDKGGWKVKIEDLKALLGIGEGQYKEKKKFKYKVLNPVAAELKELGDFWFEAGYDGEWVVFKFISSQKLEKQGEDIDRFIKFLKAVKLDELQIKSLSKIITSPKFHKKAKDVVSLCMDEYSKKEDAENRINKLPEYIYAALKRFNNSI